MLGILCMKIQACAEATWWGIYLLTYSCTQGKVMHHPCWWKESSCAEIHLFPVLEPLNMKRRWSAELVERGWSKWKIIVVNVGFLLGRYTQPKSVCETSPPTVKGKRKTQSGRNVPHCNGNAHWCLATNT